MITFELMKMETTYNLNSEDLDEKIIKEIKKLFKGKKISITISSETDETEYLNSNTENEKFLRKSMAEEPSVIFTPPEFKNHLKNIQVKSK